MHTHISAEHNLFDLKLKETWQYRDLIRMFTKRSFQVSYAQTILGPLWLFIKPLLTSLVYVVLFGNIAGLSTDGIPMLLFYLTGNAIWEFFSNCFNSNANTFVNNARLFGKVYFPRLVVPISNMLSAAIRWAIQMILVVALAAYYIAAGVLAPNWAALVLVPLLLVWLGLLGMGCGIIISSLTTTYRDLQVLVGFGVTLWMYATPVVYPLSTVKASWLRSILAINPVTAPVEIFRYAVLGTGTIDALMIGVSLAITAIVVLLGIIVFNRVERTFMDRV